MRTASISLLALLGLLFVASPSSAQTTPRVQVTDFTVDGDPPPSEYRTMLTNAIQPTIGQIEQCYDRRLAVTPTLAGDFRLRLWVSARQVIRTTPESSVNDSELEECTRAAIRTFTLPPQAPEGGATVRFVVRFTAPPPGTIAPVPTTVAPTTTIVQTPIAPSTTELVAATPRVTVAVRSRTGALAADAIASAFPALVFEPCATGITGTMTVSVSISTRGRVTASASRGTTGSAAAASCAVRQARTVTAPTARRASTARLTLTFLR